MRSDQTQDKYIFSLDIGTRSVIGVVSKKEEDKYIVVDYEILAHPDRAMLDGQIHDIDKVTKVVGNVKSALEDRVGIVFSEVSIAAAGRALKTSQVTTHQALDPTKEVDVELMAALEMQGVQEAQNSLNLDDDDDQLRYHCVGYSIINYFLDGTMIINPKGHRGSNLKADIVATFLPHIVVDSLYTVMGRCGLAVASLTLEPIAAINISIPQKLRLLNLALVDVGAGTSDVAITRDGTILSYGMVDKAGDELTEALLRAFLLDFESAESLKIRLMNESELEFTDIVGITHKKSRDEILEIIRPAIEGITESIAQKIKEINERAPSAIFCIGGGCQIPLFVESLANAIDIANERVVIKGTETLEGVIFEAESLEGPEFITPLGIGFTKSLQQNQDFIQVMVNEVPVRLLNAKKLKISDALILVGFHARKLLSERGEAFNVKVNGQPRRIPGAYGEPAKIWINGVPAGLGSEIANQDRIVVEPATSGEKNKVKLKEFIDLRSGVIVDSRKINFIQLVKVNSKIVDGDYVLSPNDEIEYDIIKTAGDLAAILEMPYKDRMFIRDEKELNHRCNLNNGDKLNINKQKLASVKSVDLEKEAPDDSNQNYQKLDKQIIEYENDKSKNDKEDEDIQINSDYKSPFNSSSETLKTYDYDILVNGKTIKIRDFDRQMVFVDIFNYIDFDLKNPKGIPQLKLNGNKARYTDKLKSGDVIIVGWEGK